MSTSYFSWLAKNNDNINKHIHPDGLFPLADQPSKQQQLNLPLLFLWIGSSWHYCDIYLKSKHCSFLTVLKANSSLSSRLAPFKCYLLFLGEVIHTIAFLSFPLSVHVWTDCISQRWESLGVSVSLVKLDFKRHPAWLDCIWTEQKTIKST